MTRNFPISNTIFKAIREDIAEAAIKSGRRPEDIDFMAVTKTVDEMYINHAIDCGITLIDLKTRCKKCFVKSQTLSLRYQKKYYGTFTNKQGVSNSRRG